MSNDDRHVVWLFAQEYSHLVGRCRHLLEQGRIAVGVFLSINVEMFETIENDETAEASALWWIPLMASLTEVIQLFYLRDD